MATSLRPLAPEPQRRPGRPATWTDGDLARGCRTGDAAAWAALVRRFGPYLRTIAVRAYALPRAEADDVAQEVFLRAFEHLPALRDDDALAAWLAQTARRVALRRARAHDRDRLLRRRAAAVAVATGPAAEPRVTLLEALLLLPAAQREVLERCFLRQESYRAIADALGVPEGTVASRIARGRRALQQLLVE
jgi:RNA polymerase sigma-70 factor (ECF subfamily)